MVVCRRVGGFLVFREGGQKHRPFQTKGLRAQKARLATWRQQENAKGLPTRHLYETAPKRDAIGIQRAASRCCDHCGRGGCAIEGADVAVHGSGCRRKGREQVTRFWCENVIQMDRFASGCYKATPVCGKKKSLPNRFPPQPVPRAVSVPKNVVSCSPVTRATNHTQPGRFPRLRPSRRIDVRWAGGRAFEVVLNLRVPHPLVSKGLGLESTTSRNTLHVAEVYRDIALGRRARASAAPTSESSDIWIIPAIGQP